MENNILTPQLCFDNNMKIVDKQQYEKMWQQILEMDRQKKKAQINDILYEYLNAREDTDSNEIRDIHHIAIYIGDYYEDNIIFSLADFFKNKEEQNKIQSINFGPSYISPKYYGTPGWWFSIHTQDGSVIELFSCLAFGNWVIRSKKERSDLMSHFAVEVNTENRVKKLLDHYSQRENIKLITYVEKNELGHTYGHLFNELNNKVIELIYEQK